MYTKQTWANDSVGATPITADALTHMERGIDAVSRRKQYLPRISMNGPAHTEVPTFTTGLAVDAAFNESYAIASGALPAIWPVECFGDMTVASNTWAGRTSIAGTASVTTYRMMCDASEIMFMSYGGFEFDLFIDGQPASANPFLTAVSAGYGTSGFSKLVFPSARPRLLEFRSIMGFVALYTKKPYRIWKPAPEINPTIAVVGDSYVLPSTLSDTAAGNFTPDQYLRGIYQRMPALLGVTAFTTDGVGGTGFINPGGASAPYGAAFRQAWLTRLQPDVIIVHGGGLNDLAANSVSSIITAATAYFNWLRTTFPYSKLVFVEGFGPPYFSPIATYRSNFIAISQGLQPALQAVGAYTLDIATTRPPIEGTGYVTATTGVGNSDIYIGSDGAHPTGKGAAFIRSVLAGKIRKVLADNGMLEGTMIY